MAMIDLVCVANEGAVINLTSELIDIIHADVVGAVLLVIVLD